DARRAAAIDERAQRDQAAVAVRDQEQRAARHRVAGARQRRVEIVEVLDEALAVAAAAVGPAVAAVVDRERRQAEAGELLRHLDVATAVIGVAMHDQRDAARRATRPMPLTIETRTVAAGE